MKVISKHNVANPIFALDAVLSAVLGLGLLASAEYIFTWSGAGLEPATLRLIGILLLPWAIHNYRASREAPLSSSSFAIQLAGDLSWIAGSLSLLVQHRLAFTALGWLLYAPQLVLVGGIAVGKVSSFRRWRMTLHST